MNTWYIKNPKLKSECWGLWNSLWKQIIRIPCMSSIMLNFYLSPALSLAQYRNINVQSLCIFINRTKQNNPVTLIRLPELQQIIQELDKVLLVHTILRYICISISSNTWSANLRLFAKTPIEYILTCQTWAKTIWKIKKR